MFLGTYEDNINSNISSVFLPLTLLLCSLFLNSTFQQGNGNGRAAIEVWNCPCSGSGCGWGAIERRRCKESFWNRGIQSYCFCIREWVFTFHVFMSMFSFSDDRFWGIKFVGFSSKFGFWVCVLLNCGVSLCHCC